MARIVGVVVLLVTVIAAFSPLPDLLVEWFTAPTDEGGADAIVVLGGGGVWGGGVLSAISARRTLHGIILYRQGRAPLLVLSGSPLQEQPSEIELRHRLALDLGVPPHAILNYSEAQTTREEATGIGRMLRERGVHRILLVTDGLHMARAGRLFQAAGLDVVRAPVSDGPTAGRSPGSRLFLTSRVVQELLAQIYYRLMGRL